jgi:hypothetical protein
MVQVELGGQHGEGGPVAAWGGLAVPCARAGSDESCAASVADGTGGRAALCMQFTTGALAGAVSADGLFCACAEFRSGPDCGVVESGAFAAAAAFALLVGLNVWTFRFAQRTLRDILLAGKSGDGGPVRVVRAAQLSSICMGLNEVVQALMFVSSLPYYSLWAAFDICNAFNILSVMAISAYLGVMFRKVINSIDPEKATSSARDTLIAHIFVVVASVCVLATSRSPLRQVVIMLLGLVVALPAVALAIKVRRLMYELHAVTGASDDTAFSAALARIKYVLIHAAVFLTCFFTLRVINQLTLHAQVPAQGSWSYYARLCTRVLNFVSGSHINFVCVNYVGGPARFAIEHGSLAANKRASSKAAITRGSSSRVFTAPSSESGISKVAPASIVVS